MIQTMDAASRNLRRWVLTMATHNFCEIIRHVFKDLSFMVHTFIDNTNTDRRIKVVLKWHELRQLSISRSSTRYGITLHLGLMIELVGKALIHIIFCIENDSAEDSQDDDLSSQTSRNYRVCLYCGIDPTAHHQHQVLWGVCEYAYRNTTCGCDENE
jgi:hypothetical protein